MNKGPGQTLAYLDEWMDAASSNVSALRALVEIATTSRGDMNDLWDEYQIEIEEASHADGWTRFKHGFGQGFTLGIYDADQGIRGAESEAVQEKQREFNRRAQDLADRVSTEYFDTFGKVSGGHGPPFVPMDAVFNPVKGPPWLTNIGQPNVPPPPSQPPPAVPTVQPPGLPVVAPTDPAKLPQNLPGGLRRRREPRT